MGFTERFGVPTGIINRTDENVIKSHPSDTSKLKCGNCGGRELTRIMGTTGEILCLKCGKQTTV